MSFRDLLACIISGSLRRCRIKRLCLSHSFVVGCVELKSAILECLPSLSVTNDLLQNPCVGSDVEARRHTVMRTMSKPTYVLLGKESRLKG